MIMPFPSIGKTFSLLFTASILIFAFTPIQTSYAASLTQSVGEGINEISYRDIIDLDPTPEPTISLDKSIVFPGDVVNITVSDYNANVNPNENEEISVLVGSNPITLEETDTDTGIFVGSFTVNQNNVISYEPLPPEAARATVSVDASSGGDVILSDLIITAEEADALFFRPVTHALNVEFANGVTQTEGTNIVVQMSFANAIFETDTE
jgi:hypothetical protein